MKDNQKVSDALEVALQRSRGLVEGAGMVGYGVAVLRDADGNIKQCEPFANLVTTAGDKWYAQAAAAAAGGSAASPTTPNGMKLGSGTNTTHKSTQYYASLQTYISGSNVVFDSVPAASAVTGTDTGWEVTYVTTWPAGTATNSAIVEVAIVNDRASDATSAVANTYSRAQISSVNKAAGDSLTITWKHKFLGA